ncbi:hydroxyacid dehydrogenase [Chromatiales bacterium (ex Bugula neritina AB1)]|nr:hydroxyacid dehydrogenase [Chromatiales bacterium (ex Bugula neritina AB1)]
MKIVRTDAELQTPVIDARLKQMGHELVLLEDGISEDNLIAATADADLLLMCYTPITKRVIESSPKLKGIIKYGVGIDAIDIDTAKQHGIAVVNVPEYAEETVAEGAFTLLLALAKKLLPLDRHMKAQGWAWPEPQWLASDIAGKTVGLIGFGKIGKSMARMAGAGFRARVIAYSPYTPADEMQVLGVEPYTDLQALMQESDFVSVHCVLTPETHHLIGEQQIQAMKPTAFLINVSRGAIVDESALLAALQQNNIAGAGLDVYQQEPLAREGHPMSALYDHPLVMLSPHLTFYTHEAMHRLESETIQRCSEVLAGEPVLIKSADSRLAGQGEKARYDVEDA